MKRLMSLIFLLMISSGCSSKEQPKLITIVKETKCPKLELVYVEFNETVPNFEPKGLTVSPDKMRVSLPVNELLSIKKLMKQLRVERYVLFEVYKFYFGEVEKFNKEFGDDKKRDH